MILCVPGMAKFIQPELNGIIFSVFGSLRVTFEYKNLFIGLDCDFIYSMGSGWARCNLLGVQKNYKAQSL
jgi:hypothetical protein